MKSASIFYPTSLREALFFKERHPHAPFLAGGLSISYERQNRDFKKEIISLKEVTELYRVNFLPNTIELGTMISLQSIANKGRKFFPSLLLQAIESFSYYPVLGQATLGGNLCSKKRLDLFSVLGLLDGSLEVRSPKKSTWIRLSQFLNTKKELALSKNEIATRLRIPISRYWTKEIYRKIQLPYSKNPENRAILCVLLRIDLEGLLEDSVFFFDTEEETFSLDHKDLGLDSHCIPMSRRMSERALLEWNRILKERGVERETIEILHSLMQWTLLNLKA